MGKPKFYVEIDCAGADATGRAPEHGFRSYGTICAEGDTLEQLLDNATVDLVDQDGGERGHVPADQDWQQQLIREAYLKQSTDQSRTLIIREYIAYGRAIWKPANPLAVQFADLLAQKSFNERDVEKIKGLGYRVLLTGEHIPDTNM